jgi:hypothetical protein
MQFKELIQGNGKQAPPGQLKCMPFFYSPPCGLFSSQHLHELPLRSLLLQHDNKPEVATGQHMGKEW